MTLRAAFLCSLSVGWVAAGYAADAEAVIGKRIAAEKARGEGKRGWIAYEAERNPYFPPQSPERVAEIAARLPPQAEAAGDPARYRAEWDALAATAEGRDCVAKALKALTEPIPTVSAEHFAAYQRDGNRAHYADPVGGRAKLLRTLVIGEALDGKDRFTARIAECLDAIAADPSWVAPFEGGCVDMKKKFSDFPHYIDLTAASQAKLVAISLAWNRDRLPAATKKGLLDVLRGRIFATFLADARRRDGSAFHNWWMPDRFNWSAVCHNGCTTAILATEDDPRVRAEAIEASERLMAPCFLSGFLDDGFCEEGMGYWNYGFGNFLALAATVRSATDGSVDFCKAFPRAKLVAGFAARYRMGHGSSPLFADGNGTADKVALSMINACWPEMYRAEVSGLSPFMGEIEVIGTRAFGRFKSVPVPPEKLALLPLRDWFKHADVLIARHGKLAFAIKGGSNGDRHNHNDAGSYLINIADSEFAGDPGNENYTVRTFSRRRYESKVLNSFAHPVPRVGGALQGTGPAFGAKVLETEFTDERDKVVLDLADAYPAAVPIVKLIRTAVFNRKEGAVTVVDTAEFAAPTAFESPVIAWTKPAPGKDKSHFVLSRPGMKETLDVSVAVHGGEWTVSNAFVENPGRTQPYRVSVAMREPVLKAEISFRYRLCEAPSPRVEAPLAAPAGATYLDEIDLTSATCGAGRRPRAKRTVESGPISLAGKVFERGVGVHAPFDFRLLANGAAERFTANVGVDDDMQGRSLASVRFRVLADERVAADSGVLRAGERVMIDADLTGAKWVTLQVTDAGDGFACDHADWADAAFVFKPGAKWGDAALAGLSRQLGILTPPEAPAPRINGPSVFGVSPGKPVLFYVPVTGEKPIRVAVEGLDAEKLKGLKFDPQTRMLTGKVDAAGDYKLLAKAENAKGQAQKVVTLKVGSSICLTPPLGWNSWNCWGQEVSDAKMRRAADAMVSSGLADHGWSYIVVDDCWRTRPTETEAGIKRPGWIGDPPHMYGSARQADGTPVSNAHFPDMKAMADYIHAKGLKAGLYSVPGALACCYTFGSWAHEQKDAATWAAWGYDLVKYDWCYGDREWGTAGNERERQIKAYKVMGDCLARQARDIVYNVCNYGRHGVTEWARDTGAHYWRTNDDLKDEWRLLIRSIDQNMEVADAASPGGWNDPDMLVVGPMRSNSFTTSRLTPNEQYAHLSLWAMMAAPLFIGCDLERLDPFTRSLLVNDEVLEINQDPLGMAGWPVVHTVAYDVWARPLADGSQAVALFNRTWEEIEIPAEFAKLGIQNACAVRDVWSQKEIGVFKERFTASIPGHAALLYRLSW